MTVQTSLALLNTNMFNQFLQIKLVCVCVCVCMVDHNTHMFYTNTFKTFHHELIKTVLITVQGNTVCLLWGFVLLYLSDRG